MTERFASGKQELFMLTVPERKEKLYVNAFLELFQSQYAPHVGDVERLAGKRTRRLYVTLPQCYEWLSLMEKKSLMFYEKDGEIRHIMIKEAVCCVIS